MDNHSLGKPSLDELVAMKGRPIVASDGDKIGKIETIFYDELTREPQWIGVAIDEGLVGAIEGVHWVLVPFNGAEVTEDNTLRIPYAKEQVKDAPQFPTDLPEVSPELEQRLYAHYTLLTYERRHKAELKAGADQDMAAASLPPETPVSEQSFDRRAAARTRLRRWAAMEPLAPETGAPLEALQDKSPEPDQEIVQIDEFKDKEDKRADVPSI